MPLLLRGISFFCSLEPWGFNLCCFALCYFCSLLFFGVGTTQNDEPTQVGETGSTVVEESQTLLDEIEFTEGYTIDRGYVSPYFVKDQERQTCEMLVPRVLVTDKKLDSVQEVVPLLEAMVKSKEPLFIVCEDVVGEALSALVVNKVGWWRYTWTGLLGMEGRACHILLPHTPPSFYSLNKP